MWSRRASSRGPLPRTVGLIVLSLVVLGSSGAWAGADPDTTPEERTLGPPSPPDVVLILTDDQRWDTLWSMPNVGSELVDRGVTFENAFVVNSLCCPSRASILTGRYPHGHGVYDRQGPYGWRERFDESQTLATRLDAVGYRTALVGKYFSEYEEIEPAPPGWDHWVTFLGPNGRYFDYTLLASGELEVHGSEPSDYSTDVLAAEAEGFVRSVPPGEPLFLVFSPFAPHKRAIPAARHTGMFDGFEPPRAKNFDEANVTDKPEFIRSLPEITGRRELNIAAEVRREYEALQAVDEAVANLIGALEDAGRLSRTLLVFTTDNGISWGEHRWTYKQVPYEESIRVPFVVRYDQVVPGALVEDRLVLNIDIAPTVAEIAGAPIPDADGTSLLPLLRGEQTPWRRDFLIENYRIFRGGKPEVPTFCAVRSVRALYVRYSDGFEELYDLWRDPLQLRNRPSRSPGLLRLLRDRLDELCRPPPPGFEPAG